MIPAEKNPLTPRETALRMLEHMHDDASYGDIIHQLRILHDIDNTLNDVDMVGSPADEAVVEARVALDSPTTDNAAGYRPPSTVVLRSRLRSEWRSLADRPEYDAGESVLRTAAWHH